MTRSAYILAMFVVITLGITSTAAKPESVSVTLEKAIYAEETTGDLDTAMKLYRQIVDDAKANRSDVAEAHYRLGICYLKKQQNKQAIQVFDEVIKLYPDQDRLIKRAKKRLVQAKGQISTAEIAKLVKDAVTTISTRGENDPEVAKAVQSVDDLNDEAVVRELTKWLDSDKNTIRRSAIYILWTGRFDDITAAIPDLTKLLSHEEPLTRGMAALALGGKQVRSCLKAIINVTLNDKDAYARRAAAYALGLLGDPAAKPALNKALKDSDPNVRNNAEAALTMISKNSQAADKGPKVVTTTPTAFANDVDASLNKIKVTFDQRMMDKSWSWTGGGETFPKTTGKPRYDSSRKTCTFPVKLEPGKVYWVGINSPSHKNFKTPAPARVPAKRYVILFATKGADGKPTPIPEEMLARAKAINAAVTTSPPVVVRTLPKAFENDVSPSLDKITVTFDQAMMDGSWSWTGGGETFPKRTGEIHYDRSRRTCTMPVKLEPGKVYWVGINSPSHKNFKTPARVPAKRYVILFATKGADGKPTPIPEEMLTRAKAINAVTTSQPTGAVEAAELAARQWLKLVDMGKYDESWDATAAFFQKAVSKKQWQQQLQTVRTPVGKMQSRKLLSATFTTSLPGVPDGEYVVVQFETNFENMKPAVETVTPMKSQSGKWQVSGYYIKPGSDQSKIASEDLGAKAWKLWQKGKHEEAEKFFKQAVEANPANSNAWQGLGWSQFNQGKPLAAKDSFEKCLAEDPKNAAALNGLGWVAKGQGKVDEALRHWKKAVEAAPGATAALNGLTRTYMERKEYDQAVKYYKMWLRAEPGNADAKKGLTKAKSLGGK